jgi:hypothetical protein
MDFTPEQVAGYVLESGLVSPREVVEARLSVHDRSSRHATFLVKLGEEGGYALKHGAEAEGEIAVRREAAVYRRLAELGGAAMHYLPPFERFDEERGILVIGLLSGWEDMRSFHAREDRFPPDVAAALGEALGTIHRETLRDDDDERRPDAAPLVLGVHRPSLDLFRDASATTIALIKLIQGAPALCTQLDELRAGWRRRAVIHVDMKWDNCLLRRRADDDAVELRIIDWETANLGDPCWDIGAALSQYLSAWLFSIPVTGQMPPERFPDLAGHPLEGMHPALAACWSTYADALGLCGREREEWMLRAVAFAAGRLIQTALEAAQVAQELNGTLVLHLQLGANILGRPRTAATELLGLQVENAAEAA